MNISHAANEVHHGYYGIGASGVLIGVWLPLVALLAIAWAFKVLTATLLLILLLLICIVGCICLYMASARKTFPLAGFEVPGWQIFPLCLHCHQRIAHHRGNYYRDPRHGVWGNCNDYDYLWKLRRNFWANALVLWVTAVSLAYLSINIIFILFGA